MKTRLLLLGLSAFMAMHAHAQSTGDYRSKQSGNWNDAANWQTYDGTGWVAAAHYPTSADGEISIIVGTNISCNITDNIDQLTIEAGGTLTIDNTENFNLTAGPDDGVDLKIYGTLQWNKGWAGNCGTWEIYSGGIANINCGSYGTGCNTWNIKPGGTMNFIHVQCYINGTTINNEGAINFTPDWEYMCVRSNFPNSPGTIHNKPNGTINVIKTGSHGLFGLGGINTWEPYVKFINEGTLNIQEGAELLFAGHNDPSYGMSFDNTGDINFANNAKLTTYGIVNYNGGDITASGNAVINLDGGQSIWKSNALCNLPAAITLLVKTQLGGVAETTVNGTLDFRGGKLSNENYSSDVAKLRLSSSGTGIYLAGYINNGVFINEGTITPTAGDNSIWSGQTNLSENSIFINKGTFRLATGWSYTFNNNYWVNASNFQNEGIIELESGSSLITGASDVNVPFIKNTANGIIRGNGVFNNNTAMTNNGTIAPGLSPGTLSINGSFQPLSSNSTLEIEVKDASGAGSGHDQLTRSGDLALAGKLKVISIGNVPDGSYMIISLSSGTISGSFSELDMPLGYSLVVNSDNVVLNYDSDLDDDGVLNEDDCAPTDATKWQSATLYIDADGDGYDAGQESVCYGATIPAGYSETTNGDDCNDSDASLQTPITYYADNDGDGFGDAGNTTTACSSTPPAGYVADNTDCDDTKILYADNDGDGYGSGTPAACGVEDNTDCDDNDDTKWQSAMLYKDMDSDNFSAGQEQVCYGASIPLGYNPTSLGPDCDDYDPHVHSEQTYYADYDGDGYGDPNNSQSVCSANPPMYYVINNLDCDDADNTIYPGAPELCDGKDNDCDGLIDEDGGVTWYEDADGDGFGNPNVSQVSCTQPSGYVTNNTDCDDTKLLYADNDGDGYGAGSPVACGVDNNTDCNDDDANVHSPITYYADNDNDGFGDAANTTTACSSTPPSGYVTNNTDCNDNDNTIYPGAPELCDGKDNDCDGLIDEDGGVTWYEDADGDGFGNPNVSQVSCTQPSGYVTNNTDCNDNDNTIYPGAPELCDGKDNDCDGLIDEDGGVTWYEDADGDGFGNPNVSQVSCTQPSGYVTNNTDCDDTKLLYADNDGDGYGAGSPVACGVDNNTDCNDDDASVHPDAIEICGNGIDDNCNGLVDEACTENNPIGISINDKSIREGNDGNRLMIFYVKLSKASRRIVKVQYATQNGTAEAGSDYQASSGQLTFLPGVKRMPVAVIINSDIIPETDETMTVVLSNPVNAVITDGTGVGTIRNDDIAPVASASEESVMTASAIKYARIMPNPAQTFVKVELTGYSGQVVLELSDLYGRKLHQQKVQVGKAKVYSQQINLTNYANGNYLIRVIDENGKYQTLQLVIAR